MHITVQPMTSTNLGSYSMLKHNPFIVKAKENFSQRRIFIEALSKGCTPRYGNQAAEFPHSFAS